MIYTPEHYKESRNELVFEIIQNYSFATLISQTSEGPVISHLPLLREEAESELFLYGHCAKANPHWKHLSENQNVTVLFQGPNSYISPAWYQPQDDNVPTWNYVAVHVNGTAQVISDPQQSYAVLQKLTDQFENRYKTKWSLPKKSNSELSELLNYIVSFKIKIEQISPKFKLSQKLEHSDRQNVIQELMAFHDDQKAISSLMKRVIEK